MKRWAITLFLLATVLEAQTKLPTRRPPAVIKRKVAALRTVAVNSAAAFQTALDNAAPGDDIQVAGGTYGTGATTFSFTKPGTQLAPIVVRAAPGSHPVILGRFNIPPAAGDVDVSGFELDGTGLAPYPNAPELILVQGIRDHIHANYVHTNGGNCISTFGSGTQTGTIIEDNVLRDCHYTTYIQNDYDSWGYKIYRHNIVLDARDRVPPDGNQFLFHGYTEDGINSGYYVQENIFWNGRILLGGTNNKTRHEVFIGNVVYKGGPQLSYDPANPSPGQTDDWSNNRFWRSTLSLDGVCADCAFPNKFTGNRFWGDVTQGYISSLQWYSSKAANVRTLPVGAGDSWDGNLYWAASTTGTVALSWWLPNSHQALNNQQTLAKFKADIQAATGGNCPACAVNDAIFTVAPFEYSLFPSNVDVGRGILAVIAANATSPTSIAVDLSPVVPLGSSYSIVRATLGPWATPTVSGTWNGTPVQVPIPAEFEAYLVLPAAGAVPTATPATYTPSFTRTPTYTRTPVPAVAVTFDAKWPTPANGVNGESLASGGAGTPQTITVGSGPSRYLVVEISSTVAPLAVTAGGTTMSKLVSSVNGTQIATIFGLVSPPSGAVAVQITFPVQATKYVFGAQSFTNVAGVGSSNTVIGTTGPTSNAVPSSNGNRVIEVLAKGAPAITESAQGIGQTVRWQNFTGSGLQGGAGSDSPGQPTTTFVWSYSGTAAWADAAIELVSTGGASSTPTVVPSATATSTPTASPSFTSTPTATSTATDTPTPTVTNTSTPTQTYTPTPTPTMGDLEQQNRIRALESVVYTPTP